MSVFDALRASVRAPELVRARAAYATRDPGVIGAVQLQLVNDEWARVTRESPWFSRMRRERALPGAFATLREFAERVPVMRAPLDREAARAIPCLTRPPDFSRAALSLSTQELPVWESELAYARAGRLFARDRYGAGPGDGVFILDGPTHGARRGPRAVLHDLRRDAYDRGLGCRRFTLRTLDGEHLTRAGRALVAAGAKVVTGRCDTLDAFTRANAGMREALRTLGLKLAVVTAGASGEAERLREFFGCPVAEEYALGEDDPIAHSLPGGDGLAVFWRSWFVEADTRDAAEGRARLIVTSLYPRCFPVVRCDLGEVIARPDAGGGESGLLRLAAASAGG